MPVIVLILLATLMPGLATAEPYVLRAGGDGGTHEFIRRCPPGQSLIGIKVKAGTFVDEIVPICWRVRGDSWFATWSRVAGNGALSTGSNPTRSNPYYTRYCPGDALVAGIKVKAGIYVDRVMSIRCQKIGGTQLTYRGVGAGGNGGSVRRLYCSRGDHVQFFKLRFGRWIDRVEVTCD